MKSISKFSPFWSVVICLLLPLTVLGYLQQLTLHESTEGDGNVHIIRSHVPNTAIYSLDKVRRVCTYGAWHLFKQENYSDFDGFFSSDFGYCKDLLSFPYLSIRHVAANETDRSVLSLYPAEHFVGEEIYIDRSPYAGISVPINSLSWTGSSRWLLFEGPNFDGKSYCLTPAGPSGFTHSSPLSMYGGLQTVGSVLQGCE